MPNTSPVGSNLPTDVSVTGLTASGLALGSLSFSDADGDILTVTLTVDAGTLVGNTFPGSVSVTNVDSQTVTLSGTAQDINNFLDNADNLQYTSTVAGFADNVATLTITASDGVNPVVNIGTVNIDQAEEASFVVTTTQDVLDPFDGLTSLREASDLANTNSDANTITFDASLAGQTVSLSSQFFYITTEDTINGDVNGDGVADITLSSTADRVILITGPNANARLESLIFDGSSSSGQGGALNVSGGATLTIVNSVFTNNSTNGAGGAIFNDGNTTIINSTFANNSAGTGGAIQNGNNGQLTIVNSTFSDNTAQNDGGALFTFGGTVDIYNSTFSGNNVNAGNGEGGGIFVNDANGTSTPIVSLTNTIVLGNDAANNTEIAGTIVDNGGNILSGNAADVFAALNGDGGGVLAFNGLVPTIALNESLSNPALDVGSFVGGFGSTDANGDARSFDQPNADNGGTVDAGAVEVQNLLNTTPVLTDVGPTLDVNENAVQTTPAFIDADVSFVDPEGNFDGGTLTVSGLLAEDIVGINSEGAMPGEIGVSDDDITFGGIVIGSFTGGDGETLTVTFNSAATSSAVEALIENLTYATTSDAPTASRTLSLRVVDANGAQTGTEGANVFDFTSDADNSFDGVDVGGDAAIDFFDFDNDGDLDALVGGSNGQLVLFDNVGSATAPSFVELPDAINPFSGVDVGANAVPFFGDYDGDDDLDLLVGAANGDIEVFINTPVGGVASFDGGTTIGDFGQDANPSLVDLNGDGALDLVIGMNNGEIDVISGGAAFVNPFAGEDFGSEAAPAFIDLNNDGLLDVVIGTDDDADFTVLINDGTATAPSFREATEAENPFSGVDVSGFTDLRPTFVDIDNDGELEGFFGDNDGTLRFLEQSPELVDVSVTINVTADDDAPEAAASTAMTDEDTSVDIDVASLITEVDGDAVIVTADVPAAQGTVSVVGTVITFTPAENFNGDATVTYTVTDDTGAELSDSADITVTVAALDDAPEAAASTAMTDEDTSVDIDVASLITEVDGDAVIVRADVPVEQGTVSVAGTVITFTPAENFNGDATVTYTVTDDTGAELSDSADITVTVAALDDAPEAAASTAMTDEDTSVDIDVASLITEVDGDAVIVTADVPAAQGTVSVVGTVITFTPAENFNGDATVTYTVTDDTGAELSDSADITVTVAALDDAPEAAASTAMTDEDTSVDIDVASLITEVDGDAVIVRADVPVEQGTVSVAGTVITFTPAENFNGDATVTYTVTDDTGAELSDSADITVTVAALDDAPEAAASTAMTDEDTSVDIDVASLITEVDGDAVIVTADVPAAQGTVSVVGTVITFTPAENFNGDATVTYTVTDDTGAELSDSADITVTVAALDDAPEAADSTASVDELISSEIDVASLITEVDGDAVIVTASVPVTQGVVSVDGTVITFTPAVDFIGEATITYTVTDDTGAALADSGSLTVEVEAIDNVITGTTGDDVINGGGGDDTLSGGEGADTLNGGADDDTLNGEAGDDTLNGGDGDDTLDGGMGADTVNAGEGDDTILSDGLDAVDGGEGTDTVDFSSATTGVNVDLDLNTPVPGPNSEAGGVLDAPANAGGQVLTALDDIENVIGTDFDDSLFGNNEVNILDGGAGNDTFHSFAGADTVIGGTGIDTVLFSAAPIGITVDLDENGNAIATGGDILTSIENLTGSAQDDNLSGNGSVNILNGLAGNDVLNGEGGDDTLIGGSGLDTLNGGDGADTVFGDGGNDELNGGDGADVLNGGMNNDILSGDDGDDTLNGDGGNDTLNGGAGVDTLTGGFGDDTLRGDGGADILSGGAGTDTLFGGVSNDTLNGEGGDDVLNGDGGDDTLNGGFGVDLLDGGAGNDILNGDQGDDKLLGLGGSDTLNGGSGNDVLNGGSGDDTLNGASGFDELFGDFGNDTLFGGGGSDTLNGGAGSDHLSGGSGLDTLIGGSGDDHLDGGSGSDTISGGFGLDSLFGGAGNDTLDGGDSSDKLNGGNGFDSLTGGLGADEFIFSGTSFGVDRVTDFQNGLDTIVFDADTGVDGFDDLTIVQDGDDVLIVSSAGNVRLENLDVSIIDVTDFLFT